MLRLDKWLKQKYPGLSGRQIDEALEHRLVVGEDSQTLKKGGVVRIPPNCKLLDAHLQTLSLGSMQIQSVAVVQENTDFIVINKPAGVPSHPVSLFDIETVTHWTLARYPKTRRGFQGEIQPTLCPHRLDTDTSGALIVCLTRSAFESWRLWFKTKRLRKTYLAWCWGVPRKKEWIERSPLAHSPNDQRKMICVTKANTKFRGALLAAETRFKVVRIVKNKFLVEAEMRTGVTHQVRVHLAHSGFPLIGDALYDLRLQIREKNPGYHQLRAFKIERFEGKRIAWKVELDTGEFSRLY